MSEKLKFESTMEHGMAFEALPDQEHSHEKPAHHESHHERGERAHTEKQAERAQEHAKAEARAAIDEIARSKAETAPVIEQEPANQQPTFIDKATKALKLRQNMQHIRSQLPAGSRAFSKVIHQPVVRRVNEVSARTITRPSGLLGGGVFAFLGSLTYLYLTKHVGFTYNYLLFTLLFVGGFVVGVVLELAVHFVRPQSTD